MDSKMSEAVENTDRELWREREGDYYANSIHVTKDGAVGIKVGGRVIVAPLARWHEALSRRAAGDDVEALKHDLERQMTIANIECNEAEKLRVDVGRLREALTKIREKASGAGYDPMQAVHEIDDLACAAIDALTGKGGKR